MGVEIYVYSHIGNSRDNHEDNYLAGKGKYLSASLLNELEKVRKCMVQMYRVESSEMCCCISDGMGGYGYGEKASLSTVEYISEIYEQFISAASMGIEELNKCVIKLNQHVLNVKSSDEKYKDMGATLCGIVSSDNSTYCFNVGDSRAYQYSDGTLRQITVDNTEGQRLLDLGLLTKEEVGSFPKRKAIYKYIGKDVELIPDIYKIEKINKGTKLLLCSDGLSDVLELEEMQDVLSKEYIKTEDKGRFLVDMAAERKVDAGDNITLIIIEY